jgi:hypothetical protein
LILVKVSARSLSILRNHPSVLLEPRRRSSFPQPF